MGKYGTFLSTPSRRLNHKGLCLAELLKKIHDLRFFGVSRHRLFHPLIRRDTSLEAKDGKKTYMNDCNHTDDSGLQNKRTPHANGLRPYFPGSRVKIKQEVRFNPTSPWQMCLTWRINMPGPAWFVQSTEVWKDKHKWNVLQWSFPSPLHPLSVSWVGWAENGNHQIAPLQLVLDREWNKKFHIPDRVNHVMLQILFKCKFYAICKD